MPELAFIYFIGFIFCWLLGALLIFLWVKKLSSPDTKQLQNNLITLNYYWSDSKGELETQTLQKNVEDYLQVERSKAVQSSLIMIFLFSLLSWFGALFLFIFMISIRYLARPRLEKKLYESELTQKQFSPDQTKAILQKLNITL